MDNERETKCDQLTAIFVSIIKQSKAAPENS